MLMNFPVKEASIKNRNFQELQVPYHEKATLIFWWKLFPPGTFNNYHFKYHKTNHWMNATWMKIAFNVMIKSTSGMFNTCHLIRQFKPQNFSQRTPLDFMYKMLTSKSLNLGCFHPLVAGTTCYRHFHLSPSLAFCGIYTHIDGCTRT